MERQDAYADSAEVRQRSRNMLSTSPAIPRLLFDDDDPNRSRKSSMDSIDRLLEQIRIEHNMGLLTPSSRGILDGDGDGDEKKGDYSVSSIKGLDESEERTTVLSIGPGSVNRGGGGGNDLLSPLLDGGNVLAYDSMTNGRLRSTSE